MSMHSSFLKYIDDFTNFSLQFNSPFAENLNNLIKEAINNPKIEENDAITFSLTSEVNEILTDCREFYMVLIWNLKTIYPNAPEILNVFGKNLYAQARRKPLKMLNLLDIAYKNANAEPYNSDLIAGGFDETKIEQLKIHSDLLNEKYLLQQDYIQGTFQRTNQRILLLNAIWDEISKINYASKIIFKSSPALIHVFKLYK